ncbi:MAG: flagellar protein FlaG, partial [Synergistaceae bacterium]|nr:flagellar protein FlaG [Synergistaceae bacterium]
KAEKNRNEILAKVAQRRHLQYEVIEDAAVVQVSVINTEDGTVVRKVPPDNVVGFIRKFRSSAIRTSRRLDITV